MKLLVGMAAVAAALCALGILSAPVFCSGVSMCCDMHGG